MVKAATPLSSTPSAKSSSNGGFKMVELNSFGSVLSFAIALEVQLRNIHDEAGNKDAAAIAEKNRQKLERVRRENVVEITLEPIEGLDVANYVIGAGGTPEQS